MIIIKFVSQIHYPDYPSIASQSIMQIFHGQSGSCVFEKTVLLRVS